LDDIVYTSGYCTGQGGGIIGEDGEVVFADQLPGEPVKKPLGAAVLNTLSTLES
jgi:hypothetical protein